MKEMKRDETQRGYTLIRVLEVTLLALLMLVSITGAEPYTYIIRDDATGGDTALIGAWDPITKTCTLTKDVYGTIQIDSPGITLEGSGHSIIGIGTGNGIDLPEWSTEEVITNVTIKDLTIRNFNKGVKVEGSSVFSAGSHNIIDCNILNNNIGISLIFNSQITFKGNNIKSNSVGIHILTGSYNNIIDNTISENGYGIRCEYDCNRNLISGNTINSNSGDGIFASEFANNNISDNTISNNTKGINLRSVAWSNIISKNSISKCGTGVILEDFCSGNNIFDNFIQENQLGINLDAGFIGDTDNNSIYNNCLSNNSVTAKSDGDDNFYSNYYSDYTGSDADSNGIGDVPYNISGGGVDNSPLMKCPFLKPNVGQYAYITNSGSNTVSVINTSTNTVIASVPVGVDPEGVAVSPDGTKVYVSNSVFPGTVSVIDTSTNTITASVPVGGWPKGVAVSPDGKYVYVANNGDDTVSVIDTTTNTVKNNVTIGDYGHPWGIAVSPDGTKMYVVDEGGPISVIDTATYNVTHIVIVESVPVGVAVTPDGTKLYVAISNFMGPSNTVYIIDTTTYKTATLTVGDGPLGVAVNSAGTKVYVANSGSNSVSVIDTATNTVVASVNVGSNPYGVSVTPDGSKVYVANSGSNTVSVIGTSTNTIIATVNVENGPTAFGQFIVPLPTPEPIVLSEIQITRLTTSGSASDPHIYGDRIVYEDSRNGKSDIYMYDLSTKQEAQISTSGTAKYPAIYGDRIVWKDDRNEVSDIYMYDLSTSQETQISTNGTAYSTSTLSGPDIYNDKIVWQDLVEYSESTNLIMYDLSTQQETQITSSGYGGVSIIGFYGFAVHSDKIVMCNPIGDDASNIDMYDISTQETTGISGGKPLSPDIYGDRIVWTEVSWTDDFDDDPSHYYYNIYIYDLLIQQEIQVSTSGTAYKPAIYSDRIVWEDNRNGQNVYMYDLSNSEETQITTSGSVYCPDIYGDRIVWVDGNNIYVGTPSYLIYPVANFNITVTEGFVPLTVPFTDLSENANSWNWDFGDGTSSTNQNTTHTYSAAGNYTVNLTAINENGTDSKLATITVLEQPIVPVADFMASPTVGKAPLKVTFTDQSTGSPASWYWKFGDKVISRAQNPVHIYSEAGKYTVSLTVKNTVGSDTRKISKYIIVKK